MIGRIIPGAIGAIILITPIDADKMAGHEHAHTRSGARGG
jgi:hypothetical protein